MQNDGELSTVIFNDQVKITEDKTVSCQPFAYYETQIFYYHDL